MRFTVTWHPETETELAEIWLRASDQASVTQAANHIDQVLATQPLSQGEDFYGDRILVVLPLAVTYTISEPDLTVQILQVWHQSSSSEDAD
jgi:ParE toxin of type II toxin-antitoxin system, parDE